MRALILLATLVVALGAAAPAAAGGWATVGIAPLPDAVGPGEPWNVEITVLQHGVRPLDGLAPVVTIGGDGEGLERFGATASGKPGVYEASVVFPEAGRWSVVVDSGFGESRLTYGPVEIAEGSTPAGDGRSVPTNGLVAVGAGLVLLAAGLLGFRRLRRLAPASR